METEKVTRSENVEVGSESSSVSLKNISLNKCKFSNNDKGSITLRPKDTAVLTHRHIDAMAEESASKEEEPMEL